MMLSGMSVRMDVLDAGADCWGAVYRCVCYCIRGSAKG